VEKLALIPTTSIVNDYAQIRGGLLDYNYDTRASRDGLLVRLFCIPICHYNTKADFMYYVLHIPFVLQSDTPLDDATFLFATLSNFQKICRNTFHTWMNILNRMPGSKMMLLAYEGSAEAIVNLRKYSPYYGNRADSLAYAKQQPWIYHLKSKTALDMILDTRLKNGHTTGLDGLWAGVPTVTLGGMTEMGKRCGESFAVGLDMYNGLAFSLKEYEDIAIEYATNPSKLKTWRNSLGRKRVTESLFDTRVSRYMIYHDIPF
jgi:protein O-GlcNAc transferase